MTPTVQHVCSDCLLFGLEEALDDLRQHRLDGERVVGGVRHDCELVCGPQCAIDPGIAPAASQRLPELDHVFGPDRVSVGKDQQCASLNLGDVVAPVKGALGQLTDLAEELRPIDIGKGLP